MATGDLIKLGTFYMGGVKKLVPTRPWRNDSTPAGAPGYGNIENYVPGQPIEIRETDTDDAYQIRWREVQAGGVKLLVADRNLIGQISWMDLNDRGLISGITLKLAGRLYKLRVLSGGDTTRPSSPGYGGGSPETNEWDRIISGEAGYPGLPVPTVTDLEVAATAGKFTGAHNQFWNWVGMFSHAQETKAGEPANRVARGYNTARFWEFYNQVSRIYYMGWRPVLEVLNNPPSITGTNTSIGAQTGAFSYEYSVTDIDGTVAKIEEKVNGVVMNTHLNPEPGARTVTVPKEKLASLAFFKNHTLQIVATDDKGGAGSRTITFTRGTEDLPPDASLMDIAEGLTRAAEYKRDGRDLIRNAVIAKGGTVPDTTPTPPQLVDGINSIPKLVSATGVLPNVNNGNEYTVPNLPFEPDHVHVWYEWSGGYLGQSIASKTRLAGNAGLLITGNAGININKIAGNSFTFYFGVSVMYANVNWAAYKLL